MKKTLFMAAAAALMTLVGCDGKNDEPQKDAAISIDPTSLNVASAESQNDVAIKATGDWAATTDANWVTLSAKSGSGNADLTVTVAENESSQSRCADVKFSCGDKVATLEINQVGAGEYPEDVVDGFAKIRVSNVSAVTADLSWTVEDAQAPYVFCIMEVSEIEKSGITDLTDLGQAIIAMYQQQGIIEKFTLSGNLDPVQFTGFVQQTAYRVLIIPVDENYNVLTGVSTADFTTEELIVSDEYMEWLGTWNITSASSLKSGEPITLTVIIKGDDDLAIPGLTFSVYGLDITPYRWVLPINTTLNVEDNSIEMAGQNYLLTDQDGYDYYTMGRSLVEGIEDRTIYIQGSYIAMTGVMGADKESAVLTGNVNTLSDGRKHTTQTISVCSMFGTDLYGFEVDNTLGLASDEVLMGPFTLEKISDDATLPQGAPQRVPGFNNVDEGRFTVAPLFDAGREFTRYQSHTL